MAVLGPTPPVRSPSRPMILYQRASRRAGPLQKLKKLKECAWTEEGGSPGKRGCGEGWK